MSCGGVGGGRRLARVSEVELESSLESLLRSMKVVVLRGGFFLDLEDLALAFFLR